MKKLLSMILCIAIALFAVACGGDDTPPNMTDDGRVIIQSPIGWGGGVGTEGTRANADLFEADPAWGNKQYGKYTGVKIEIVEGAVPSTADALKTTAFSYVGSSRDKQNIAELVEGAVCVDDVYQSTFPGENRTLEDKLFAEYRPYFQYDGHYYGLAATQMHCGYAMYTQLWERDQLYIAAAKVDGDEDFDEDYYEDYHSYHSSKFGCTLYFSDYDGTGETGLNYGQGMGGNGKFTATSNCIDLCVGPDGKAGTYDDGQPSSVIEFLTLCQYMEDEENGIKADPRPGEGRGNDKLDYYDAICYTGQYQSSYDALFLDAFFASLAGANYETVLKLDSEGRDVEVVVGYSDENLYPGIDYIKKPITKKVKVTPETGYYVTWMVEKFYTEAVMRILQKEGYFNYGTENATSHVDAQYDFLIGLYENSSRQEACAFIFDGSYLNNEMRLNGHFDVILANYDSALDVRMEFAVPPSSINDPVTCEAEGDAPVLVPVSRSFNIIPKSVESDPDKLAAVKAWALYLRSDVAMARNFMYTSSFHLMLGNDLMDIIENNPNAHLADHEYFNYYKKKYIEQFSAASEADRVMHPIGGTYINPNTKSDWYTRGYGSGIFYIGARGSCYTNLKEKGVGKTFEGSQYLKSNWDKIYLGTQSYANVPEDEKVYKIDGVAVEYSKYPETEKW